MILLMILCRAINPGPDPEHPAFFQPHNFIPGLLFGWSILLSFSAAALLFSVTTMTEIKDSLDLLGLKRLSLGISLMLGFLPRFFVIWETAETAYRARCGKKDLSQISLLAPLVIERMLEMAAETAAALESRGCSL
jgi:biotin transport system permease protein